MVRPVNCSFFEHGLLQRRLCRSSSAICCGSLSARYCSSTACNYMDDTPGVTPTVFWSILGVLSGIGALIIGITYLICRFKKPTNQVADRHQNMVEGNFVHTDVRTVLYPDNHLEHHCLQPVPVVRLETNRPPSYGAAPHQIFPSAVTLSTVPGTSMPASPTPITTSTTTTTTMVLGSRFHIDQSCPESWAGFAGSEISNIRYCHPPPGDFCNINSAEHALLKPTLVLSGITRPAQKVTCASNFLSKKHKITDVAL